MNTRRWSLITIFAAALAIKLGYLLQALGWGALPHELSSDMAHYHALASRLASGGEWGPDFSYQAMGYPLLITGIYWLFGPVPELVYGLQFLCGMGTLVFIYLLGLRLGGEVAGFGGAMLALLYWPATFYEAALLPETLSLFVNAALLYFVIRASSRRKAVHWVALGILAGFAGVLRPIMFLFIPLVVLALLRHGRNASLLRHGRNASRRRQFMAAPAYVLLGALLPALAAASLRIHGGESFSPLPGNGGISFFQGNNQKARGAFTALDGFSGEIRLQRLEERLKAVPPFPLEARQDAVSSYWFGRGFDFLTSHPLASLHLLLRKLHLAISGAEYGLSYKLDRARSAYGALLPLLFPFSFFVALAIIGFLYCRTPGVGILGLYVAVHLLGLILFYVSTRYRLPLVAALAPLGGWALSHLAGLAARGKGKRALILAGAALGVGILLLPGLLGASPGVR